MSNTAELGARQHNTLRNHSFIAARVLGAKIAADPNSTGGGPAVDYTPGHKPDTAALRLRRRAKAQGIHHPGSRRHPQRAADRNLTSKWLSLTIPARPIRSCGAKSSSRSAVNARWKANPLMRVRAASGPPCGMAWTIRLAGECVSKSFGTSANNQQSAFCDTCCRDHHDGSDVNHGWLRGSRAGVRPLGGLHRTRYRPRSLHPQQKRRDQRCRRWRCLS